MATPAEAVGILNKLADELRKRQTDVEILDCAYRGDHRLHYASQNFRDFFADRYKKFADNWCGIVADAPHERLEVTGIRLAGEEGGDKSLFDAWRMADGDAGSDLAMLEAIVAKRSYGLVWGDDDGELSLTWEHPSQAIVSYDPETRARKAGAKVWCDDDDEYATLYLPGEVWKFQRPRVQSSLVNQYGKSLSLEGNWAPRDGVDANPIENPLGKVPLVELQNRPRLMGEPFSDIQGTLAMQHAINLLWAQLFAVSDEATLGQRLIIGAEPPMMPILDDDGNVIGEKPLDLKKFRHDQVAFISDPTAKAFQWQPANLKVFTDVVEIAVGHIAAQSRTPANYLLIGGTIANVSGDAMKALETGLVQRTREKTQHFGRAIRDIFELVALVEDDPGKAKNVRGGQVLWADVENRSDAQTADAAVKDKTIGLPLRYILERRYNLSPLEIDRVMDMRDDELSDPAITAALKTLQDPNAPATPPAPVE